MGVLCVVGVVAGDEDDAGAELFGFADLCAGFDAEGLGFVTGGDAAGGVGHGGYDGERLSAVLLVELLFDGREEAVEVDVEKAETVGMEGDGHDGVVDYIRFLFAFNDVVGDAERITEIE
jgi:hypothetical protein